MADNKPTSKPAGDAAAKGTAKNPSTAFAEMPDDLLQAGVENALKQQAGEKDNDGNMKISAEEADRIRESMKKPEFTKYLREYMDEISDPRHRAEQEAYIKQMENEGKVPEGCETIHPKAGFCVKTKNLDEKSAMKGKKKR